MAARSDIVPLPRICNACQLLHIYGLGSSPFAHHYSGNRFCFLFLGLLRCFTSPRSPCMPILFSIQCQRFSLASSLIRISTDHRSFAAPRGFSQLTTSFLASWCLGIHRTPLIISPNARILLFQRRSSLKLPRFTSLPLFLTLSKTLISIEFGFRQHAKWPT